MAEGKSINSIYIWTFNPNKAGFVLRKIKNKDDSLDSLKTRIRIFGAHILTALIDGLFLALWVVFHCGLDYLVIKRFGLSGINRWVLFCFQIVFATYTLILVVLFIYEHIAIMAIRTQRRISQELKGGKKLIIDIQSTFLIFQKIFCQLCFTSLLIEGDPGSGKSMLTLQVAKGFAKSGKLAYLSPQRTR